MIKPTTLSVMPDGLLQNLMGFASLDIDDKADAAGIMLKPRIVKALLRRQPGPPWPAAGGAVTSFVHFFGYRVALTIGSMANWILLGRG